MAYQRFDLHDDYNELLYGLACPAPENKMDTILAPSQNVANSGKK